MQVFCILCILLYLPQTWSDDLYKHCVYWIGSKGFSLPGVIERIVLNDIPVYYYDSNMRSKMPRPKWLNSSVGKEQWNTIHDLSDYNIHAVTIALQSATQQFNLTGSLTDRNIYQGAGCCIVYPDGTYQASLNHAFNGKEFLSFDVFRRTYVAAVPQAVPYKHLRERDLVYIDKVVHYYSKTCLERLNVLKDAPEVNNTKGPEVRIIEKQKAGSIEVTCHVTGFYPRSVQVYWLGPDLQSVDKEVSDILPNEDGTYQTRKSVIVPEEDVGKHTYSCVVLHSAVTHNITRVWAGEKNSGFVAWICLAVTVLAAGTSAGFVIWRHCCTQGSVV
ncbi:class I histocompatibility antigen, F10 alpha chain-like [Hoplias malabaricus]|uniref:class I histocompatibility antigen, F10 alpha chain-like n=1 Tax=Hoplias malabaricus TaxID=27720 RepID=UPI003462D580